MEKIIAHHAPTDPNPNRQIQAMLKPFEFKHLRNVGAEKDGPGIVEEAWNQDLANIVRDLIDRPAMAKERTLTLTMRIMPYIGDDGKLAGSRATYDVKCVLPNKKSKAYDMGFGRGGLLFNKDSDDNHKQRSLSEAEGGKGPTPIRDIK